MAASSPKKIAAQIPGGTGREAACKRAEHAALGDGLADAAGQQVSEPGQRHARTRARPARKRLIDADSAEQHARHHIQREDARRRQPRLVDQHLTDHAQCRADEKCLQILCDHAFTCVSMATA